MRAKRQKAMDIYKTPIRKIAKAKVAEIALRQDLQMELLTERKVASRMKRGCSYEDIADELGISTNDAFELGKKIIQKWGKDVAHSATETKVVMAQQIDAMIALMMEKAFPHAIIDMATGQPRLDGAGNTILTDPDIDAIKTINQLMERKSKLLGLDAADKHREAQLDMLTRRYLGGNPDEL